MPTSLIIHTLIRPVDHMSKKRTIYFVLLFLNLISATVCAEPNDQETTPLDVGFVVEMQLGNANMFDIDNPYLPAKGNYSGLMLGAKLGGIILGLGFSYDQITRDINAEDIQRTQTFNTMFLIPSLRTTLLSSQDKKVELFAMVDFGVGISQIDIETDMSEDYFSSDEMPTDINHILYQIGPGVRYWVHPQFSLGVHGGLKGDWVRITREGVRYEESLHRMGIFTSFNALAVF